ncbi:hypothetical protein AHAS_Ahas17G0154700 [Arachis hypogaea]
MQIICRPENKSLELKLDVAATQSTLKPIWWSPQCFRFVQGLVQSSRTATLTVEGCASAAFQFLRKIKSIDPVMVRYEFKKCILGDYKVGVFRNKWDRMVEKFHVQEKQWIIDILVATLNAADIVGAVAFGGAIPATDIVSRDPPFVEGLRIIPDNDDMEIDDSNSEFGNEDDGANEIN